MYTRNAYITIGPLSILVQEVHLRQGNLGLLDLDSLAYQAVIALDLKSIVTPGSPMVYNGPKVVYHCILLKGYLIGHSTVKQN